MNKSKKFFIMLVLVCVIVNGMPTANAAQEDPRKGLDYSDLELQIGIANGLTSYDYTVESWQVLQDALDVGNKRLAGIYDQGKLDAAAEDIANALAGLVKMDYSALNTALDAAQAQVEENPQLHDVWSRLNAQMEKADGLLISGDQKAVDAAAQTLNELLQELADCSAEAAEPEVVVQEVEVEVLPTGDFCNIPVHRVWPVVAIVSLVVNIGLAAALIYVIRKKRNTTDDTPLVSYDIEDDIDY